MAAYSYKEVCHRPDYQEAEVEWAQMYGQEPDGDPGYDGDCWWVTNFLLDKKDAEIARLKQLLEEK